MMLALTLSRPIATDGRDRDGLKGVHRAGHVADLVAVSGKGHRDGQIARGQVSHDLL